MKRKIISTLFALVLVAGFSLMPAAPAAADGTTYYVATTGNDSNSGNITHPWLTIGYAISQTSANDTIMVAAGTYTEDLTIDVSVTLQGESSDNTTIKGVATEPDASFPLAVPNIDILSSGVKIHGFTIEGPDAVAEEYASGMLIGASNVEIYDNDFKVTAGRDTWAGGAVSTGIVTYRKVATGMEDVDISGLNIHDNTFTSLGAGAAGFDAIFVNLDTGMGSITIADNDFTGNVTRAISVERSNVVISGNDIITDLAMYSASAGGYQGMYIGCFPVGADPGPVQTDISITGNTVKGATASDGFAQGIRVGHSSQEGLDNITVSQNTVQYNDVGIVVKAPAEADPVDVSVNYNNILDSNTYGVKNYGGTTVELDAENNWWGTVNGPSHAGNTFNVGAQGDASSDDVDYCPWLDDVYATGASFAPVTVGTGTTYHSSIQAGIDAASANDTITAAMGTFTEDLSIPAGKDNLELKPATDAAVTIKGVATEPDASFPLAVPNIDILSSGVKIHGFTIEGPDAVADKYASGMLIGASNVEIYDNAFKVTAGRDTWAGAISTGIITYRKVATGMETVDISGLNIHDNTFTNHGAGAAGFDAIFVNLDTGTGTATIADNNFTGNVARAISAERSNMVISGNNIITDLAIYSTTVGGYQGMFIGCFPVGKDPGPVQTDISITGNTVKGSTASDGFAQGIRVGHTTQAGLEDITVLQNTVQYNDEGITVRADASGVMVNYNNIIDNSVGVQNDDTGVELDATCNWWGDVAGPSVPTNPYSGWTSGDSVSSDVDYIPWLIQSELAEDWNIWSAPIAPDAASWAQMQADLVEAGVISIYYFDSATQLWGADADDAGPLDAFYIKMPDDTRIRYCINDEATFPGQKAMKVGWNLIGLAELHDMHVDEAVLDAYWGTGVAGNLTGYSKVISPSLNGVYWIWQRDGEETPDMYPTRGYWVFMVNDGTLGGFTLTPIVEEEIGP